MAINCSEGFFHCYTISSCVPGFFHCTEGWWVVQLTLSQVLCAFCTRFSKMRCFFISLDGRQTFQYMEETDRTECSCHLHQLGSLEVPESRPKMFCLSVITICLPIQYWRTASIKSFSFRSVFQSSGRLVAGSVVLLESPSETWSCNGVLPLKNAREL